MHLTLHRETMHLVSDHLVVIQDEDDFSAHRQEILHQGRQDAGRR